MWLAAVWDRVMDLFERPRSTLPQHPPPLPPEEPIPPPLVLSPAVQDASRQFDLFDTQLDIIRRQHARERERRRRDVEGYQAPPPDPGEP